jgi:hypothetical protein
LSKNGRELTDKDLFPLHKLNIKCTHLTKAENPLNNLPEGTQLKNDNFYIMMDNTMSAKTRAGNTRFKESENPDWT